MHEYVVEVRHAADGLIQLIEHEFKELRLLQELGSKFYDDAMQGDPDDLQPAGHLDFRWMSAFARADATRNERHRTLHAEHKLQSMQALAGALLQIAKQGISTVYGRRRGSAPPGRTIGVRSCLRDVIWEARNQALHYEDGQFHPPVVQCFEELHEQFHPVYDFTLKAGVSKALDVVHLLRWHSFDAFAADMEQLLTSG